MMVGGGGVGSGEEEAGGDLNSTCAPNIKVAHFLLLEM